MGKNWYRIVHKECNVLAAEHGLHMWQVAGVITSLSAQKKWDLNIKQARQLLSGIEITGGMVSGHQLNLCERILHGEDPLSLWARESYKYRNFYACILNPECTESVCVDSHMINWYLSLHPHSKLHKVNKSRIFESYAKYSIIQKYIRKQAQALGLLPMEHQAIVWTQVRSNN